MPANLKPECTGDRRAPAIGAAIALATGLLFLMTPLGDRMRLRSYDWLFVVRPATAPVTLQDVVILSMDEESRRALHQEIDRPWDRTVHTRLVKELQTRGAKIIVFDVLWDEPSPNRLVDEELAKAINKHGRVVLAAHWHGSLKEGELALDQVPLRPADPIGTNAPWGLVEWPIDPDASKTIRRQFYHPTFPTMAWQAAALLQQTPPNRALTYWLNYYGGPGTITTVSYHHAFLPATLGPDFFAGKTVFVGKAQSITSQGQVLDTFPTPLTLTSGKWTPGVEIEATAFLNLVRREWLTELSPWPSLLIVLVVGLAFGWGLSLIRPWLASAVALVGVGLVAAASAWLAWEFHLWFPWLVVCGTQIPAALAWAALAHTRRVELEKEGLRKDVALAESIARLPELLNEPGQASSRPRAPGSSTIQEELEDFKPPPIPNHHLLRCIGRGAYGEVWLARDEIGTYHAVKVIHRRRFSSAEPYEREFRGIQKFTPISRHHPGFVHILHVGRHQQDGYFFYIMELADDYQTGPRIDPEAYQSHTLFTQLEKQKRIPLPGCVQLGLDLCSALTYLHGQQLIHRDIKPANILFVNGAPKFADVGLVTKLTTPDEKASLLGTEGYMAPEGPGTAAADVYSLGKVLYEAATGLDRRQFPALPSTLIEVAVPELSQWNDIILQACHEEVGKRFQTAAEFSAQLRRLKL